MFTKAGRIRNDDMCTRERTVMIPGINTSSSCQYATLILTGGIRRRPSWRAQLGSRLHQPFSVEYKKGILADDCLDLSFFWVSKVNSSLRTQKRAKRIIRWKEDQMKIQ